MTVFTGVANGHSDMMDKLETALTAQGHAWGARFSGTGNGKIVGVDGLAGGYVGGAVSVAEMFTITATSSTSFTVVGSSSGSLGTATVGTPFTSSHLNFLIQAGGTAFVSGDEFTINTSLPYDVLRKIGTRNETFRTSNMVNGPALWDRNPGTYAEIEATSLPAYAAVQLRYPSEVKAIDLTIFGIGYAPEDFELEYSDNGSSWTSAQSWPDQEWSGDYQSRSYAVTGTPGAHLYWRLKVTSVVSEDSLRLMEVSLRLTQNHEYYLDTRVEIIFEGYGYDGTRNFKFGAEFYEDTSTQTYNFSWYAMRNLNQYLSLRDQLPDVELVNLPLTNQPFTYWFFVNGQRVVIVARIGSVYLSAYLGFGFPYDLPTVHDWPMIIAAGSSEETRKFDYAGPLLRSITDPCRSSMKAYFPTSGWRSFSNIYDISNTDVADSAVEGSVWPASMAHGNQNDWWPYRDNLDGTMPLFATVLCHRSNPTHVWGELDGVYVTTGFNNSPEAIITKDGYDHIVFQNVFRNTYQDFFAVRMD